MEPRLVLDIFLVLAVTFKSTLISADNPNTETTNETVTYKTTTLSMPENTTETLQNKTGTSPINTSAVLDFGIGNEREDSVDKHVRPSDEIIIGNFNDLGQDPTRKPTPKLNSGTTQSNIQVANNVKTTTTNSEALRTYKTDAIISVTKPETKPFNLITSKEEESAKITTTTELSTTGKPNAIIKSTTTTKSSDSLKPEMDRKPSQSTSKPEVVTYLHMSTSHSNSVDKHAVFMQHHIPFRHHLQLVPMEDEPFGAVLLKDQRYIVSVLIPVGVGIIGALVIMVTVYGLRHVAKKHGREFPRVDIEAGRQNIASISSERTDKMLLLDDDEDNEF